MVPSVRGPLLVLLLALCLGGWAAASRAESRSNEQTHWGTLKFHGLYSWPLGDNTVEAWNTCDNSFFDFLDFYSSVNVNNSAGCFASFEYVFARRYGLEATFMYWHKVVDLKIELPAADLTIEGAPNFIMPVLGFNYHFLPGRKADLYAGVIGGLGVIATGWGYDNLDISKDMSLGLNLALDYYFHPSWHVGTSMKYLDFGEMDFSIFPKGYDGLICNNGLFGVGDMRLLSLTVGVGYRF